MGDVTDDADSETASDQGREMGNKSKGCFASSSESHLKSYFVGMGFASILVDKVLKENGDDNVDLLLETLFAHSATQKSSPESSDCMDGIFSHCQDGGSSAEFASDDLKIEEVDIPSAVNEDRRASLLMMNFSVEEVEFAINRIGEEAPIDELVDFITAAQIAKRSEQDENNQTHGDDGKDKDITTETVLGTMDKKLRLLEMGFSEDEITQAIEKFGAELPISDLADSIFATQIADTVFAENKNLSTLHTMHHSHSKNDRTSLGSPTEECVKRRLYEIPIAETVPPSSNATPVKDIYFDKMLTRKKPKHEYEESLNRFKVSHQTKHSPFRNNCQTVSNPPYFLCGNVVDISHDTWAKLSQFLYAIAPEFVNTQFFSAFSRREGYIHNLPTDNRSHILPRPPMTIEEAMPHTKRWWPSWDTRKQLSNISSDTRGIFQLCESLGKMLIDSKGKLSKEQQTDIVHHCKTRNLLWVGQYKLSPIEPDEVERILGYPSNHTQVIQYDRVERLRSLKNSFQIDTLGYHLSSLKSIFPDGLTMLSLFSGIGGAEIALHRLGIHLKSVVSVESSETNGKILRNWWNKTEQTGELVQIQDINKLTSSKLEKFIKDLGGFDLVICKNPCTHTSGNLDGEIPAEPDFPLFFEFVRVLQRVRSTMARTR
ncbi:C-5 cytosine methyltransferase [Macleaya cordata]|uniref:DNA (cytosine-5-)-methyltransferase n=1 Tax=Macleaya cordata TaxID=56857 RepID=A0A200R1Y2_MACCD|nr:C-5 cytosine methyltransferase [Macleaya cordata]